MKFATILVVIEVGGTIAFAMSGLLEAIRKRMDIIGVFSVAFVSAFGGGTVRDVLLDRRPLFWIQHQEYVWLVIVLALTAPLWLKTSRHQMTGKAMEFADACGLGLFAISGATIASSAGMPPLVSVLMGAITAVFGGVSRDVLCNQIPKVYHDHSPYTLCAVVGCAVFLGLDALDLAPHWSTTAGICTVTGSRLLAVALGLKLPAWPAVKYNQD
ncbi:MAG: trimeric intracellular cation channel family protein [Thauera sp.]|nr:trimeric intracellular cation channel family protein [Thauera sp.]